jgi:FkbM family methyltransferase
MELNKLNSYIFRRKRARQVGFPLKPYQLGSTKDFMAILPEKYCLNGKTVPIRLPDEHCIRYAYMEVVIEDAYGLQQFPHNVKTILDIGANVGIFSLAAREAFPEAVIHAYEPNPGLEPFLKNQSEVAGFTYFLEAVQRESGFVHLSFTERSLETTSTPDASGDIPATAFRKTVERIGGQVDFVKLDCEGAEWEILEDREAWQSVRYVSLEYHRFHGQTDQDAVDLVRSCGFEIQKHTILPYDGGLGIIQAVRQ